MIPNLTQPDPIWTDLTCHLTIFFDQTNSTWPYRGGKTPKSDPDLMNLLDPPDTRFVATWFLKKNQSDLNPTWDLKKTDIKQFEIQPNSTIFLSQTNSVRLELNPNPTRPARLPPLNFIILLDQKFHYFIKEN